MNKTRPLKVPPKLLKPDPYEDTYQIVKQHEWKLRLMDNNHEKICDMLDVYSMDQMNAATELLNQEYWYVMRGAEVQLGGFLRDISVNLGISHVRYPWKGKI